ncbi:MAG: HD domain-containing protein [Clostridia bacterium]|nr:HD domain-containing protein [Clostridia bacterium]
MAGYENGKKRLTALAVIVVLCVALNTALVFLARKLGIPLYLDSIGTALSAMLGGSVPGVLVGFFTNLAGVMFYTAKMYYGLVNVLLAIIVSALARKGAFSKVWKTLLSAAGIAVFCAILSSLLTWYLSGMEFGEAITTPLAEKIYGGGKISKFLSLLFANVCIEGADKFISVIIAATVYKFLPAGLKKVNSASVNRRVKIEGHKKGFSIITKFAAIMIVTEVMLGTLAAVVSYYIYKDISIKNYTEKCNGVSEMVASCIDPELVDSFVEGGAAAEETPEYKAIDDRLYDIKNAFPQIEYIYAYKILPDGCHVVFDLDESEDGGIAGQLIEFDESFSDKIDDLLAGKAIEPMITDDTYGWLLTVYTPVYNSAGECVCYAAADIQMQRVRTDEAVFLAKMLSMFFSVSVIIIAIITEIIHRGVITPINSMARASGEFAFDIGQSLDEGVSNIMALDVSSRDEIGDLYASLCKMATDTSAHIGEVESQAELIRQMQESIIMDFAEMVEARDKCTGDHIKKTSYYVGAIAEEMKREGIKPEILTNEYIAHIKRSAPLHDVGKIKVSDIILNKPGRLTDEEFAVMKTHTTEGEAILKGSMSFARNSEYLREAANMAAYHHEWWNGKGYPYGLSGEDIPLGARIMAVADVFDALVSRRSYKEPFSFEKAVDIIKEESGTHFDPEVVKAFLNICERFRTE